MRMVYSDLLAEHFERPRRVGQFTDATDIGTGVAGSRETGGLLRLQLRVDPNGYVSDACFKAFGPPALIAAGSWLAESLVGGSMERAETIAHSDIVSALELPPVRLHYALLAEDAVRAAIQDYKDKQKVYA